MANPFNINYNLSTFSVNLQNKIYNSVVKIEDRGYASHYFHFMELFLGSFCWANGNIDILICNPKILNKPLLKNLIESVSPNIIYNKNTFSTKLYVIADRNNYSKDILESRINKIIDNPPNYPNTLKQCKIYYPRFVTNVYNSLKINPKKSPTKVNDIVVTYILREPNEKNKRHLLEKEKLFNDIRKKGIKLQIYKLEELDFYSQVNLMANTDILIGVHGNGLTNLLWLPKHATVLEIFDKSFHHYDYQIFSEIANLNYIGFCGDQLWRNGDRMGPVFGKNTRIPVKLNNDLFINEFQKLILKSIHS